MPKAFSRPFEPSSAAAGAWFAVSSFRVEGERSVPFRDGRLLQAVRWHDAAACRNALSGQKGLTPPLHADRLERGKAVLDQNEITPEHRRTQNSEFIPLTESLTFPIIRRDSAQNSVKVTVEISDRNSNSPMRSAYHGFGWAGGLDRKFQRRVQYRHFKRIPARRGRWGDFFFSSIDASASYDKSFWKRFSYCTRAGALFRRGGSRRVAGALRSVKGASKKQL